MKSSVKRNFSIAARNYEKFSLFQRRFGEELLRRLDFFKAEEPILDLGSGTGELLKGRNFVCLDISLKMAKVCSERSTYSVCGDAEYLPFKEGSFPTLLSNFSFQWTDLRRSIPESHRVLKEEGLFFLSIPVEGSLKTLFSSWKRALGSLPLFEFPKESEVYSLFNRYFEVIEFEVLNLEKEFRNSREALKCVTGVGARNPFGSASFKEAKRFLEAFNENPKIEYRALIVTGKRRELPEEP